MMTTVSKLHKMLGALLEQGHGRKPIVVNKPSFYDAREGDGCVLLEVHGIKGPRWIPMADDDGGTKWNADGTESGKQVVVLFGCLHDLSLEAADALQALEPDDSGIVPDSDKVICPGCSHQFTAIPGNVQARLQALERVPMTTADMVNVVKAAGWPADTNDRQLVAAFNLIEATEAHHGITPPESKG